MADPIKITELVEAPTDINPLSWIEVVDVDDTTDGPSGTTKKARLEGVAGGNIEFFNNQKVYNAEDVVLRSESAQDDGVYDSNFDYRLYLCKKDGTVGNWSTVSTEFQEIVFVLSDSSISGDGTVGNPLSVSLSNVSYTDTVDGVSISSPVDALDFLLERVDFTIVADTTERDTLDVEEGKLIYNTLQSRYEKYINGAWETISLFTDIELDNYLQSKSVTIFSDVTSSGSGEIITDQERSRLQPNVVTIDGSNKGVDLIDDTLDSGYWILDWSKTKFLNESGSIIKFNSNSLSITSPILIDLPIDTLIEGWHIFAIVVNGNTDLEYQSDSTIEPFNSVSAVPGFLTAAYNIGTSTGTEFSVIGNIFNAS